MPTLRVEIDFANSTSDSLVFDDATLGKFDTGTFAGEGIFVDVSGDVREGSISRGLNKSDRLYATAEAGTLEIVLDNRSAKYDPTNEDSPYWDSAAGATLVQPMRRVRIRAPKGGSDRPLWFGYVDSYELTYPGNDALCTIRATDAIKVLANITLDEVTAEGASELTGARIGRVLDAAGWDDDARDLADGTVTLLATTLGEGAWDLATLAAESEIGALYLDPTGKVVFRDRDALADDARSKYRQAVFGQDAGQLGYSDFALEFTDENIANAVTITRDADDAVAQTASDDDSQAAYLKRTFDRSDLPLETDTEASTYAAAVLSRLKDPQLAIDSLVIIPTDDALFEQAFRREIGDRIEVNVNAPGRSDTLTRTVFIRGISHEWGPDSWVTTWTLADASYLGDGIQNVERDVALDVETALALTASGATHEAEIALAVTTSLTIENAREAAIALSAAVAFSATAEKGVNTDGPNAAARARSLNSGIAWSNPGNAIDGDTTTRAFFSDARFSSADLWIDQFGLALAAGSTILGVQFDVVAAFTASTTRPSTFTIAPVKSGTKGSAVYSNTADVTKQTITIGGPTNTLGFTLADVNSSSSGLAIDGSASDLSIYEITMTVYYTP